jgi:hypothetical protein
MPEEDRVQCPNCRREVVPRLWLTGGDHMTYMTTQHLCPYCGVVMYETGGTIKRRAMLITVVLVCLLLILTLAVLIYTDR